MITIGRLIKQFNFSASPQTILRGSGAWENALLTPGAIGALTFGAAVPVSILATTDLFINLATNAAFQFSNATGPSVPALVILRISNTAGVAHGAGTFDTKWKVTGNVTAIATANQRVYLFLWDGVDTMIEISRGAADVPN
jgi:hypothetical protein